MKVIKKKRIGWKQQGSLTLLIKFCPLIDKSKTTARARDKHIRWGKPAKCPPSFPVLRCFGKLSILQLSKEN